MLKLQKSLEWRLWYLGLTPAFLGCIIVAAIGLYLSFETHRDLALEHNKFIATLLDNIATDDPSTFNTFSDRLIQAGNVESVALMDNAFAVVLLRGDQLGTINIKHVEGSDRWQANGKIYFSAPLTYSEYKVAKQGWLIIVEPELSDAKQFYRLLLILLIPSIAICVLLLFFHYLLKKKIITCLESLSLSTQKTVRKKCQTQSYPQDAVETEHKHTSPEKREDHRELARSEEPIADVNDTVINTKNIGSRSAASPKTEEDGPVKVLVVDDYSPNLRLVCELLRDMAVAVDCAESGEKAIEYCKVNSYALILMDLHMPGLNGLETTKIIRENQGATTRTPIVALTAQTVDEERSSLLLAGMDDFLTKPVGEAELTELLSRWTAYNTSNRPKEYPVNTLIKQSQSVTFADCKTKTLRPVDIEASLELAKGKVDLAKDMLSMLLSNLESDLSTMRQAWGEENHQVLHDVVHRIHGGSCYCGVPNLLASSGNLDKALKTKSQQECKVLFEAMVLSCDELILWYKNHDLDTIFNTTAAE